MSLQLSGEAATWVAIARALVSESTCHLGLGRPTGNARDEQTAIDMHCHFEEVGQGT